MPISIVDLGSTGIIIPALLRTGRKTNLSSLSKKEFYHEEMQDALPAAWPATAALGTFFGNQVLAPPNHTVLPIESAELGQQVSATYIHCLPPPAGQLNWGKAGSFTRRGHQPMPSSAS